MVFSSFSHLVSHSFCTSSDSLRMPSTKLGRSPRNEVDWPGPDPNGDTGAARGLGLDEPPPVTALLLLLLLLLR